MDDQLKQKFFRNFTDVPRLDAILLDIGNAVAAKDSEGLDLALENWCRDKTKLPIDKDRYLTSIIHYTINANEADLFKTFLAHGMHKFKYWQIIFRLPDPRPLLKVFFEFVNVNQLNGHKRPEWWQILELEDSSALEWLLENAKPNLTVRDVLWKLTVLDYAAMYHNAMAFRLLVAAGADPGLANSLNSSAGMDLMGEQTEEEDPAIPFMEFLLDEIKVDIDEVSNYGRRLSNVMYEDGTALHAAIRSGVQDRVLFLLERGADPSIENVCGDNALEFAEKYERLEAIELLQMWSSRH